MIFHSIQWAIMNNHSKKNVAMGLRLRDERMRLNFIQLQACQIAGVLEQAWVRYEKGDPFKLEVIEPLQLAGFDMVYVVFGVRHSERPLKESEQNILRLFNQVHADQVTALVGLLETFVKAHPKS